LVATTYLPGCSNVACSTAQVDDAKKIAAAADATVLVMGADLSIEAESRDRVDILLPGQQQLLITAVANASTGPVILVIMSGGGMDVSFAKTNDKITSILWVGYPGEAGGAAIADIIFGSYNPSTHQPSHNCVFLVFQIFSFDSKSVQVSLSVGLYIVVEYEFEFNQESLSRWEATDDLVSTIIRRQSTNDKYEHETRSLQWLSWQNLQVLHRRNCLLIWRWTKLF
jgi:hypothetical protein